MFMRVNSKCAHKVHPSSQGSTVSHCALRWSAGKNIDAACSHEGADENAVATFAYGIMLNVRSLHENRTIGNS